VLISILSLIGIRAEHLSEIARPAGGGSAIRHHVLTAAAGREYDPAVASSGLTVRAYRPGDEQGIQAAFEAVFERKRSLEEWRWRFQEPPAGPGIVHVLESEGAIVGHFAHVLMPTWVDGQRVLLGQGGDTMTLPECRGRGGMRSLVEAALSQPAYDLRMNFPSAMAEPLFVRYGAGRVVGMLPTWVRRHRLTHDLPAPARPFARAALAAGSFAADHPRPRQIVEPLVELGAEVDELAAASASFARCIRIRDAAYLRWRWLEQPDARWEIRAARTADGRLAGISVLGLEAAAHGRTGWINDLLAPDGPTLRALLVDGVRTLVAQGASSVHCQYLDPRPWARQVFLRSGFLPSGEGNSFICRTLSPVAGDAPDRVESWYLTRSDTEPWPNLTER
jgi:hypothetical protein